MKQRLLYSSLFILLSTCCFSSFGFLCCEPKICYTPCDPICKNPDCGYPFFSYRSQGANLARQMVGWQRDINLCDTERMYGSFYIAPEYTRTFRPCNIARYLFCSDFIQIQGSQVENRNKNAWLADYFGLPQTFKSVIAFRPDIKNFIIDVGFYLGLDEIRNGLFFKVHTPLVHSKWQLCPIENVEESSTEGFEAGYMSEEEIARTDLPKSFLDYMRGETCFGDMKEKIRFGKISGCCRKITRLADIHIDLGYNFICNDNGHFGLSGYAIAPTGNRPEAIYLFEPTVGNQKHWGLGLGITSSIIFWNSDKDEGKLGLYMDANIAHLFKTTQCRSFDFKDRRFSRYMLLEEMGDNEGLTGPEDEYTKATYQYQKSLVNAVNVTTLNVNVKIDAQIEAALKLGYTTEHATWDIGYNVWARTGETFCPECVCTLNKKYAIKGDSYLYGRYEVEAEAYRNIPLSAIQNFADIHGGKNWPLQAGEDIDDARVNPRIDKPQLANFVDEEDVNNQLYSLTVDSEINTSIQPTLVTIQDLNLCKSPSAITHKLFFHYSYAWDKKEKDWRPYLGIGGEVEFDGKTYCTKSGASQWGIWLKGGFSFE